MESLDLIEDEVRDQLRARAIDPEQDIERVREIIGDVVAQAELARARAGLPATHEPTESAKVLLDSISGLGPLQKYLDDPTIEEVWLNDPSVSRYG